MRVKGIWKHLQRTSDDENTISENPPSDYDSATTNTNNYDNNDWGEINDDDKEKRFIKFHVSAVTVKKMAERVQYYDSDGKLVTESFKGYTHKTMSSQIQLIR
jgi:type I restriction enzyme R subunit